MPLIGLSPSWSARILMRRAACRARHLRMIDSDHSATDPQPTLPPVPRRNPRRRTAVLVALLMIGAASYAGYQLSARYPRRLATVRDGVLYRSAQPKPRHLKTLVKDFGIKTLFIVRDVGGETVQNEIAEARRLGLRVIEAPVVSRQPVPPERIREFFDCLNDPANLPVLVHCSAGRHRTGVLCAAYRMERDGWSNDRAVEELLSFGFDVEPHRLLLDQVRAYRPRAPAAVSSSGANGEMSD